MKRRLFVLVAVAALLLAACGSSGEPVTFADQPGSLPESIAEFADAFGIDDPDSVPLVQRNFLEGCVAGDTPRLDGLSGADLAAACACSYDGLTAFLLDTETIERPAFETFKELDKTLEDEGSDLANQYVEIFDGCREAA